MKNVKLSLAIAGAVLALLFTSAESCSVAKASNGVAKACDTKVTQVPTAVKASNGLVVVQAKTKSVCDRTPQSHIVHLTLWEKMKDNSWKQMGPARACFNSPSPGHPETCEIFLPGVCETGTLWRLTVLITGTGPDGNPFSFDMPEKPTHLISSCPEKV